MNKKIILGAIISTCIVVMVNSVSAVEYRVVDDHITTVMLSKIEKIDKTLEKCTSFFKNAKRDLKLFPSTQDGKILAEKVTELKTTMVNTPSRPTCIRLILQFIIALIFSIIGTIFGIVFGPLLSLVILILVSPAIILAKIITFIINIISILIP